MSVQNKILILAARADKNSNQQTSILKVDNPIMAEIEAQRSIRLKNLNAVIFQRANHLLTSSSGLSC